MQVLCWVMPHLPWYTEKGIVPLCLMAKTKVFLKILFDFLHSLSFLTVMP